MKSEYGIQNSFGRFKTWLAFSMTLTFALAANAQSVLVSPPETTAPTERYSQTSSDSREGSTSGTSHSFAPGIPLSENPFEWGPLVFHPGMSYGITYGTGLHSRPGRTRESVIQTISPTIGLDIGSHWRFGYTAQAVFYSDSEFRNVVDHDFSLGWNTTYEEWAFGLSQKIAITADPEVETAQQTDRDRYTTGLTVSRQILSDFSFDLSLSQNISDAGSGATSSSNPTLNSRDWAGMGWLNYHWGPNVASGLGVGAGYTDLSTGPDMTYENFQGRVSLSFTEKFRFSVNGGLQDRQFLNSNQSSLLAPTFGVTLQYYPFEHTAVSLSASRSVSASTYLVSQVTESTGVDAGISQRLFGEYSVGVSAGYANTSYKSTFNFGGTSYGISREDNYSYVRVNVSRRFLSHGTISASYSISRNTSNSSGYTFNSNQVGLNVGWRY